MYPGNLQCHFCSLRDSGAGRNPGGGAGILDGLRFLPVGWLIPLLSFPLCRNGLFKPLDSSLRWNDDGGNRSIPVIFNLIPVSLVIPACLQQTGQGQAVEESRVRVGRGALVNPSVIPAKAGIQGGGAGVLGWRLFLPD